MAHSNVFLVDEMLEKNPGMTYAQAVKALAAQEKVMAAAKSETVKEAKSAPAPTADTPKGGAGGMLPASVQKALGLDLVTPTSSARVSGMTVDPNTGVPKSRALDILTAASPYFSPGTGAAKTALGKAASILLPTGAAAHEAFKPSTAGQQAEQGVGGIANFLRESGLLKIPGLSPLMQSAATMGGEGVIGNLLNQAIDRGPENISGQEAAGSGLLGGLMGLAGGVYPTRMGTKNSVQAFEDLTAPSGPLSELATAGVKKDFTPIQDATGKYLKAVGDMQGYGQRIAAYQRAKAAGRDVPIPKPPGPQAATINKFFRESGFDAADTPFLRKFSANPDVEIDGLLDKVFAYNPKNPNTAANTAANQTLNKVVSLFGKSKSGDVLKQKTGEYIMSRYLNPSFIKETDNPMAMFENLRRGGESALDKILSKEEREAMSAAVDAVKTIARSEHLGNLRFGWGGSGGWISLGGAVDRVLGLTPAHMATHILYKAKNDPNAGKEIKAFAEYIRGLKTNPLTGGRLTRAATETIEKGLLGLGAAPVDAESVLPPTRNPGRALFTPGR